MKSLSSFVFAGALLMSGGFAGSVHAGERALIDTTQSPSAKMYMVDLSDVKWTDGFWADRFEVCRTTMIPNMWKIFQDEKGSHAWAN